MADTEQISRHIFDTLWGKIGAEAKGVALTGLFLPGCIPDEFPTCLPAHPILLQTEREVTEYFAGSRQSFTVTLAPAGTSFMHKVWRQLCRIPFGSLFTYGDIARTLGNPGAARAVGMACGRNPIPLLIPCHRVVGAGNKLTGFSGGGVGVKRRLIEHESEGTGIFGSCCPDHI